MFRRYASHETLGREAHFGLMLAARALGDEDEYRQLTNDFVARYPNDPLAEEALNDLAREYILDDEDEKAAETFAQMVERFPSGAFAERATWKAGWWAFRTKDFAETVRLFEHGAATFPRSDYRPSWLYWSARAYDQLGDRVAATDRYRLTATDYLNSYYGRLAWRQLEQRNEASVTAGVRRGASGAGRTAAERQAHRAIDRAGVVPAGAQRGAIRAEDVGRLAAAAGDAGARAQQARQPAPGHQRDEAGLPAVSRGGRRTAAAGNPAGDLSR